MPQQATGARETTGRTKSKQESHRLQDVLAVAAVTIGITALILGGIPATHFPGAVLGVVAAPRAVLADDLRDDQRALAERDRHDHLVHRHRLRAQQRRLLDLTHPSSPTSPDPWL